MTGSTTGGRLSGMAEHGFVLTNTRCLKKNMTMAFMVVMSMKLSVPVVIDGSSIIL